VRIVKLFSLKVGERKIFIEVAKKLTKHTEVKRQEFYLHNAHKLTKEVKNVAINHAGKNNKSVINQNRRNEK